MKNIKFFVCCLVFISLFSCTKKKLKNDEFILNIENYMLRIPSVDIDNWNIPRFKIETFFSEYELKANLRLFDCVDNEILYFIIYDNRYHLCKWDGNHIEIKWTIW